MNRDRPIEDEAESGYRLVAPTTTVMEELIDIDDLGNDHTSSQPKQSLSPSREAAKVKQIPCLEDVSKFDC